jgi:cache domain-containing protein
MGRRFPRINQNVLTAFLVVSAPVLIGGVLVVLMLGQARMRDFYGEHLAFIAQQTAAVVDAYVYRKILDVSLLGRTPEVRQTSAAASAQPVDAARIRALDEQWVRSGQVPPPLASLFDTSASRFFADIVAHDQVYRELLLTDRQGRLVAASNRATDYDQADEDWWKAAFDDGVRGRVSVTDVRWDDSARTLALEVAVPVAEPGSERLVGVMKAVIDARELLASVAGLQPGVTGQATLVRDNGSIVFSRTTPDPNARFFATQQLAEGLQRLRGAPGQGDERLHFRADGPDGAPQVVGVAPSQLSRSYPNVTWLVAISQSEEEFLAPMRSVGWYLAAVFGVALILVLLLALWFSMRLAAPQVDIDMALVDHGPVSRMPDAGDSEEAEEPKRRAAGR